VVDELVTKIGWIYSGQDQVQRYLTDQERIARQAEEFNRLSSAAVRSSAFGNLGAQAQSGLERTTLREYDDLTAATLRLRDAELARAQVHKQLSISTPTITNAKGTFPNPAYNPQHPKFIGEWNYDENGKKTTVNETGSLMLRERADNASLRAVNAAAKAQQQAFDNVNKAEIAEAKRRVDGQAKLDDWWHDRQYDQHSTQLRERAKVAAELNALERKNTLGAIQGYTTRAREDIAYNAVQPKYDSPDVTTKVGKLQDDVNEAASRLARAQSRQATIATKAGASADERIRVDEQVRAAERRLILAENKLAGEMNSRAYSQRAASMAGGSGGGGFGSQFMTGFHGRGDRPYAEQIGQAFKFSVFYGTAYKALFALTATLQQTLQEGIEFQQAMTELKIASGASADAAAEMADGLAAQATMAGAAPSQGVMLGARSLGLFGATESSGASLAEQERIAEISARVVSRMALGSKTDPMELQTQIAAVANAFGGGAQGQIRAYDLDAYLGRRFGVMPGETIQSVAESGTVGQAAGFNQEEVFAIAAALQSRTGQTSSAVAGWMAQIFSRGGEGSLVAMTGKYGIDQSADLATQIQELARVYENASNTERAEIAAGFGRGKVQNAAVVMLDEFDTIMREARSARSGATGEGDRIFELRMNDIGGQIQQTVAVMKAFASELGQSGVLDVLGGMIIAFRELVEAATSILQVWNQLPGVVKGAVASIALLGGAARMAALSQGGAGLLSRAGLITPSLAASTGVRAPTGSIIAGAGASGYAAAGKAALATVGPFAAAIGGLLAISALKQSSDRMREAQEGAEQALRSSGLTRDSTSSDYVASASELDSLAQQNRDATGWFMNAVTFGQADDSNIATAQRLEEEAARRRAVADAIDARAAANPIEVPALADFQPDTIKNAFEALTASGGTADDRLRLLADALDGTGDAAIRAAAAIDPDEFAGRMANSIRDGVKGIGDRVQLDGVLGTVLNDQLRAAGAKVEKTYDVFTGYSTDEFSQAQYEKRTLSEVYTPTESVLQDRLKAQLAQRGITDKTQLDRSTSRDIARSLVSEEDFEGIEGDDLADARKSMVNMIARQLRGEAVAWRQALKKNTALTKEEVMAVAENIDNEFDNKLDGMQETDFGGRVRVQTGRLRRLLQTRRQSGAGDVGALTERIASARRALAESQFDELENLRRAAQRNATSRAEVARVGQRFMRREIRAAIRGGNQDLLARIIGQAGDTAVDVARAILQEAINAARAAREAYLKIEAVKREAMSMMSGIDEFVRGGVPGQMPGRDKNAEQMLGALGSMQTAGGWEDDVYSSGSDVPGFEPPKDPSKDKKSKKDREAEREQARQEMLDLQNNLYLLSIDLSDPLAMATAAVKDARRRLQSDIASGQDRGTVAASRVALRQAQIEREATAFQQRLEAVQTAEELGRISHRKYISYLESERKRLGAIKNRTYQQQQQLDEIDRLMKSAAESMQGQWNFGDIKLPTPYQVRRQVEQMRVDRVSQLDAASARSTAVTTIHIDGADTGKVRQIIKETLGSSNRNVTTRPRRR